MNRIKTTIFLLVFPLLAFSQFSQAEIELKIETFSEQELVMECSIMLTEGYYYQAGLITDKLLEINPTSSNYNYRRGYIHLSLNQNYNAAIPHLEKAILNTDKLYDMQSASELSAPIDAFYYLAKAYHLKHQISLAEQYYTAFIERSLPKSPLVVMAQNGLKQCLIAKDLMQFPKTVKINNVGSKINTEQPEYSPIISLDGTSLYFTSRRMWENNQSLPSFDYRYNLHPEDVYISYLSKDSVWGEPIKAPFNKPLNNEATLSISPDERRIYVYEDSVGNGDIFYSEYAKNKFKDIEYFDEPLINTKYWEPHCSVTPDGKVMFFVSDRNGGFGGTDIYRCVKLPDGKWSIPVNCGPQINTEWNEDSPFIAIDHKTLYFSSNGSKSMGGYDIFVSLQGEDGTWSQPINLGYPINAAGDDLFYTTTIDGSTGYFTSQRDDSYGNKDIYQVNSNLYSFKNLIVFKGRVHVKKGAALPEDLYLNIQCLNCGETSKKKVYPRLTDGLYIATLDACREYEVSFSFDKGKKEIYNEAINTNCTANRDEIYRDVWLDLGDTTMGKNFYLAGKISESGSRQKLEGVAVKIYNKATNELVSSTFTDKNGKYYSDTLETGANNDPINYKVVFEKEGYLNVNYEIPIVVGQSHIVYLDTLINSQLLAATPGNNIGVSLKPIYFNYNDYKIRKDAAIELDKVVAILKNNPAITIELGAHTDARGDDVNNQILSEKRAQASADYIISKGIDASRITAVGYGESKLLVSNEKVDRMKRYRDKEVAHQKNRRTEFIITNNPK